MSEHSKCDVGPDVPGGGAAGRVVAVALAMLLLIAPAQALVRLEIPGAVGAENLPSGAYAALVPNVAVQTHGGSVPIGHGGNPLYIRITEVGGFQFAGQSDVVPGTLRWNGAWWTDPRVSYGISGHIFDLQGVLQIIEAAPHQTSQGFRYVEQSTGRLVSGDETYSSAELRLSEYTTHGDVTIGQGWSGGAVAVRGAQRVVLEPGHTTFIRYNRSGNNLAVAITKLQEQKVVLLWLTVEELAAFPAETVAPAPPPPDEPPPPAPPEELPQPQPDAAAARAIVERERARFGAMSAEQVAEFLRGVATTLNAEGIAGGPFGVLRKPTGTNCAGYSCDIICAGNGDTQRQWDVLGDADPGGAQTAGWSGPLPTIVVRECEVPDGGGSTPPLPDPKIAELEKQIVELSVEIARLQQSVHMRDTRIRDLEAERAALERQLADATKEIERLRKHPAVECEVTGAAGWLRRLLGIGCALKYQ